MDAFLHALLGAVVGGGAIGFVVRSVVGHVLSRDLEQFKADLQKHNAVELERLRSQLERVAIEHQVRYARQLDIISDLWAKIDTTRLTMLEYLYAAKESPGTKLKASREISDLQRYTSQIRVFLPRELADQLHRMQGTIVRGYTRIRPGERDAYWDQAITLLEEELPVILEDVESHIRSLLGTETGEPVD